MTKLVIDFAPHITHKHYEDVQKSLVLYGQDDYTDWITCDGPIQLEYVVDEFMIGADDELIFIVETKDWESDTFCRAVAAAYRERVRQIYFSGWEVI